jgi:hypothetical protein
VCLIGERLEGLVAPTGAEVIAHPSLLPDPADGTAWPEDTGEAMQVFLDESIAVLPKLLESDRPDAVLYDIGGFAGRVAAHYWGVPAIQLSPTYIAWEGYEQDMAEFTDALKVSPSGVRYVFAGPCIGEARTAGWTPGPGDDRPLVYVSFGTAYTDLAELYQRIAGELSNDYRLVFATGKIDPADVEAARTQPQLDVLAHADVFITHAGMGGTVESLWFGVPTVAVPQAVDQFTNAAQLEAIGAGVQLGEAADAVERLLA